MADEKHVFAVETMDRKTFFENIVSGFAKSELFSKLVCMGVDSLSYAEKTALRTMMIDAGIPRQDIASDLNLAITGQKITARSVRLD